MVPPGYRARTSACTRIYTLVDPYPQTCPVTTTGLHQILTKNFGHLYNDIKKEANNCLLQLMTKFAKGDEMNED